MKADLQPGENAAAGTGTGLQAIATSESAARTDSKAAAMKPLLTAKPLPAAKPLPFVTSAF
jgi:hypothetical protein